MNAFKRVQLYVSVSSKLLTVGQVGPTRMEMALASKADDTQTADIDPVQDIGTRPHCGFQNKRLLKINEYLKNGDQMTICIFLHKAVY